MSAFPQAVWPALAEFDAEKLVSLQLAFDQTTPGSAERTKVQAEIAEFTQKFRVSAQTLLRTEQRLDLERLVEMTQSQREFEARIQKDLFTLLEADLTMTEMLRLRRLIDKFAQPTTEIISKALAALQNRDSPAGRRRKSEHIQ